MEEQELIKRLKGGEPEARRVFWDRYNKPIYDLLCRSARVRKFQDPRTKEWKQDLSDVEDIMVETFSVAITDIQEFRNECPLEHWLFAIASNKVKDFYRNEARHHPTRPMNYQTEHNDRAEDNNADDGMTITDTSLGDEDGGEEIDSGEFEFAASDIGENGHNGEDMQTGQRRKRRIQLSSYADEAIRSWHSENDNETHHEIERLLMHLSEDHRIVLTLRGFKGMNVRETASIMGISEDAVRALKYRAASELAKLCDPVAISPKGGRSNG